MKKKKFNSFLALLLAATMAFAQPASAYAAEVETAPVEVSESIEETEEAVTETETEEITAGETETEEVVTEEVSTGETAIETETETEEAVTEEVSTEETATETETEETVTEETTEEATTEEVTTEEVTAESVELKTAEELGFKTMTLSSAMIEEKAELSQVVTALASMKADEDYLENQVVYFAETEEEAKQIAECYGGTLAEYEFGVAVATIKATVKEAIDVAADPNSGLPAVYPNIVYKINDGWNTAETVETETAEEKEVQIIDKTEEEAEETETEISGIELPCEDEQLYATAPNDAYFADQWHHDTMNTVEAWNATKGKGVTVAVIDTGIDYEHPDLKGNYAGSYSTIGGDGRDDNGHGTHCAGIIAATANNGVGVSGMAPEAKIYAVKVLNARGSGSTADITQGVIHATSKKVDVISMSLGGVCWDALFQKAIDQATNQGIVVVAAAGNESVSQKSYPAAYNNVIAVAATDYYDELTYFSNYGKWVDIAAPGYNILATLPTNFKLKDTTYVGTGTGYGYMSGTSMACPVVAGTVALMLGNCDDGLRNRDDKTEVSTITKTLINSCDPYGAYAYWANDPNRWYPLADAEACTYAVDDSEVAMPDIYFSTTPSNKNVVLAGADQYFELKTSTEHAKIYYTINGSKPTAKTGRLYTGKIYMPASGKMKIQAVAVVGTKTSKVFSKTYTFDVRPEGLSSICEDEMTVAVGKSIQLSVNFAPYNTSNQKLIWSSDDASGKIKVNNKGKVTCKKGTEEGFSATITAKTDAKTVEGKQLEYKFKVTAVNGKAETLTLNATSLNMSYWAEDSRVTMKDKYGDKYVSTFKLVPSVTSGVETDQYLYKSSNTKVATVDSDGTIHAMGKGKATITVTANDGSGKKATCKVTVVTPVFDIYMETNTMFDEYDNVNIPIAAGCSVTVKTELNYDSSHYWYIPSNKKLDWTSDNPNVKVKNGKVTCGKDVLPGTKVTITAKAKDGFGATETLNFVVTDKIKKIVYVDPKKGETNYSSISCDLAVGEYIFDLLDGSYEYNGWLAAVTQNGSDQYCPYFYTETSNRDVVYRVNDYNAGRIIIGTKPGRSKVTYKVLDGSNTKFTINFKVTQ